VCHDLPLTLNWLKRNYKHITASLSTPIRILLCISSSSSFSDDVPDWLEKSLPTSILDCISILPSISDEYFDFSYYVQATRYAQALPGVEGMIYMNDTLFSKQSTRFIHKLISRVRFLQLAAPSYPVLIGPFRRSQIMAGSCYPMHFVATYCFYLNLAGFSYLPGTSRYLLNMSQKEPSPSAMPCVRISALSAYELKSRLADGYDISKLNRKLATVAMERQLSQRIAVNGCVWFVEFGIIDTALAGVVRAFKLLPKSLSCLLHKVIKSRASL